MSQMNPRSLVTLPMHARFGLVLPLVSTTLSRLWPSLFADLLLLLLLFGYTSTAAAQLRARSSRPAIRWRPRLATRALC